MGYKKLKAASLYGLRLFYRIENRGNDETLILSTRNERKSKVDYEAPPIRVKDWQKTTKNCFSAAPNSHLMLEALPKETHIVERFCVGFAGIDSAEKSKASDEEIQKLKEKRRERRSDLILPLGILLYADKKKYLDGCGANGLPPNRDTVNDRRRAIDLLLRHEGYTIWPRVTPAKCAGWLDALSEHDRGAVSRLMKTIFAYQVSLIDGLEDPWEDYSPKQGDKKPNQNFLNSRHNERISLTDGQCAEIFKKCDMNRRAGKASITEFAVLLLMTVSISVEELCALTYGDLVYLRDFGSRMVVRIINEYAKDDGEKKNHLRRVGNKYKERFIPLTYLAAKYFEALKEKEEKRLSEGNSGSIEDKADFCAEKRERRLRPEKLAGDVLQYMMPWMPESITGAKSKKFRAQDAVKLLQKTAEQHMERNGYEEEEIRRMKGLAPLLVSAKSYMDFVNEPELNKLGAMMDCWVRRAYPCAEYVRPLNKASKRTKLLMSDRPDSQTYAVIRVSVPPMERDQIPKQGVTIRLSAQAGISGSVKYADLPQHEEEFGNE